MRKILLIILSLGILATLGIYVKAQVPATAPTVTVLDVKAAGFGNVVALEPTGTRFQPPNYYFRVKELLPDSLGWGDASNIVGAEVIPKLRTDWVWNNGQPETVDAGGKAEVRLTTDNYYIVVGGPDKDKVMSLANILKAKYK